MLKLLKATLIRPDGQESTVCTYAQDTSSPEEVLSPFLSTGFALKTYELIDTLTEHRRRWNLENPDNAIPLDG